MFRECYGVHSVRSRKLQSHTMIKLLTNVQIYAKMFDEEFDEEFGTTTTPQLCVKPLYNKGCLSLVLSYNIPYHWRRANVQPYKKCSTSLCHEVLVFLLYAAT